MEFGSGLEWFPSQESAGIEGSSRLIAQATNTVAQGVWRFAAVPGAMADGVGARERETEARERRISPSAGDEVSTN